MPQAFSYSWVVFFHEQVAHVYGLAIRRRRCSIIGTEKPWILGLTFLWQAAFLQLVEASQTSC